jgi:hypothetical protein
MHNTRIIYTRPDDGGVSILIPSSTCKDIDELATGVPVSVAFEVINIAAVPSDRTFRNAWKRDPVKKIDIDIPKAKEITHERRRAKRADEFAPLDIEATIPAKAAAAEAARETIRQKYAAMQIEIDGCTTAEQLKTIIDREGI